MDMTISSTAFADKGPIPKRCTCEGEDVSPPLSWSNVPERAKSLVLIEDDPEAPDLAAHVPIRWRGADLTETNSLVKLT